MRWYRFLVSVSVFLLAIFLVSSLHVADVSAATVDCSQHVTELSNNTTYSLASCDTSSLDSTLPWYYYFNVTTPGFTGLTSGNAYLCFSNASSFSCSNPQTNFENTYNISFRVNTRVFNSLSHFMFSDVSSTRIGYFTFSYGNYSPVVDFTYSLTITDSFGSSDCPVCEECQVCPAIPENPYDDKFDKIITAIYVCAATVLVVYFFYCIYRMIIKTTGGIQ